MADAPTPASEHAAASPPTASITSSTVLNMPLDSSQNVKMSSVHISGLDGISLSLPKCGMAESSKSLAHRLKSTREALDVKPADVCKRIKVSAGAWSEYEGGTRRIPLRVAIKFCEEFGLTLDWIYRADPSRLPNEIRLKMRDAA